ncbi:unnamed protein product [Bursaphelenchus xylophilus]|uniref:(pine wood nematode) hypothetical protein n=1 Tax=Bursaphelenchus xylophilus TaxID=6326 RepID=A0A1I7SBJ5_BURXY|nr:unnamed protein product [Bursaphelenchus xylophilus]CAG9121948.1 unnamed protein product [Bursaphelenchus xylophilus]
MNGRLKRILEQAQVPPVHKRYVRRAFESEFEEVVDKFLEAAENDKAALSITGLTGTGKSALIRNLLWHRSDIVGHHFKRILFISDENTDLRKVPNLITNALFSLWKEIPDEKTLELFQNGPELLLRRVIDELQKVLIILDGVYLEEVVNFFKDLRCSLIITTNRRDLTNHIDNIFTYHITLEHTNIDDLTNLSTAYGLTNISRHYANVLLKITGGNFGLLEKLFTAAKGSNERLKFLVDQLRIGISTELDCISYYSHRSLYTPIDLTSSFLRPNVANQVVSLALLQMGVWLRIEILAKLWSVDLVDSNRNFICQMISAEMSHLAEFSLLDNSLDDNEIRVPPLFRHYLLAKTGTAQLTTYNKFIHRLRTDKTESKPYSDDYLLSQLVDPIKIEAALKRSCRRPSELVAKTSILDYVYEIFNHLFRR